MKRCKARPITFAWFLREQVVEQAQGRTGSFLMVHGGCVSIGCYAITDEGVEEVYGLVEAALDAGQPGVHVHAFPFRMSEAALKEHADHPAFAFWQTLRPAFDRFEATGKLPDIHACGDRYAIDPATADECQPLAAW